MKRILVLAVIVTALLQITGCGDKIAANTVRSADDLNGKKIGVLSGAVASYYADGYGTLHTYESAEAMLVDVKGGFLDCAVMNAALAKSTGKKVSGLKILKEPLVNEDFRFAIAKENPDLLEDINAALTELSDSGTLDSIIEGYAPGGTYRYTSPDDVDRSHGTLTLAVDAVLPPYSYMDSTGKPAGIDIDVARAVCDLLRVELAVSIVEESELVITVQYGKADFSLGGITDNEEDAKLVVFSEPYTTCTQVIVVRQ